MVENNPNARRFIDTSLRLSLIVPSAHIVPGFRRTQCPASLSRRSRSGEGGRRTVVDVSGFLYPKPRHVEGETDRRDVRGGSVRLSCIESRTRLQRSAFLLRR